MKKREAYTKRDNKIHSENYKEIHLIYVSYINKELTQRERSLHRLFHIMKKIDRCRD